jgi:hypothetical protein
VSDNSHWQTMSKKSDKSIKQKRAAKQAKAGQPSTEAVSNVKKRLRRIVF